MGGNGGRVSGVADLGKASSGAAAAARPGLGRSYDGYIALGSFTVAIEPGELVALIGPNGAGKTTFLNLAAGLLDPTSGKVEIAGQAPGSIEARRALASVRLAGLLRRPERGRAPGIVAALHGIADPGRADRRTDRAPRPRRLGGRLGAGLSKGMEQQASIAFALVRPFEVLLADEPLDGLDPPSREVLFDLLAETTAAGAAIVVSTHRPNVIAAADRCGGIRPDRLAYDGAPKPAVLTKVFDPSELEGTS